MFVNFTFLYTKRIGIKTRGAETVHLHPRVKNINNDANSAYIGTYL